MIVHKLQSTENSYVALGISLTDNGRTWATVTLDRYIARLFGLVMLSYMFQCSHFNCYTSQKRLYPMRLVFRWNLGKLHIATKF